MSVNQRRPRRRWLWLVPAGLVIAGLVLCFGGWQYYKTTPAYSLALLVEAAQQNDQVAFDQLVDMDQVIDNFIAQGPQGSPLSLPAEMVSSVRLQLESLAPETMAKIKEGVREEIRGRTNELSGSPSVRPFLLTALGMPFVTSIKQSGDKVQVKIDRTDQIELFMEHREGSNWKIISLRDQALAGRVVNNIMKDLPQSGSQVDQGLRKLAPGLAKPIQSLPFLNAK